MSSLAVALVFGLLPCVTATERFAVSAVTGSAFSNAVLDAYDRRLTMLPGQVSVVTGSAQAAADLVLAEPRTSLILPALPGAVEFANELLSRAGGLAKALNSSQLKQTGVDRAVVLVSVRSWEQEGAIVVPKLAEYRSKGYSAVVFGSSAGRPADAVCDYLVDNGAPGPEAVYGQVNIIVNVTLGWIWCCEYAAALSRQGKYPGILKSIALQGARENNARLQSVDGRRWLGDTTNAVPAGKLANIYLKRAGSLAADMRSPRIRKALSSAADIVAARIRDGRTVQISGIGHIVNYEILRHDLKMPSTICRYDKLGAGLKQGDLAVWFGYMGNVGLIKTGSVNRLSVLQKAGVDVIFCEAPIPDAGNTPPEVLAQVLSDKIVSAPSLSSVIATVAQCWSMPDAEVEVPWPPGQMAPVSGINALLLLRTLDEQVAVRLKN
ncbi:MAG: hypothetical protein WCL16_06975 [bacterium]